MTTTGPGGSYVSETAWNWGLDNGKYVGTSGGVSTYYGIPSYQQGINMSANLGSTTMRNVPDVALTGDNVYVIYHPRKHSSSGGTFGGTSCAAPLWAAFMALVNQQAALHGIPAAGFINPAVYAIGKSNANYTSLFHDVTNGNNFWPSSSAKFPAVAGYDLCTGWGTPTGTNLINALAPALVPPATISGTVRYYPTNYPPSNPSVEQVGGVTMNLTGGTNMTVLTLGDGSYSLPGISAGGTYGVTPVKTDDSPTANGLSSYDAALIQRHVLNLAPLNSPYKLLAADVAGLSMVSSYDAALVQRVVLGLTNRFPAGLWRFVPADYVFPDTNNPWNAPTNRWYTNLVANVTNGDFVAIKLGDVANLWTAPSGGQSLVVQSAQGSQALAKDAVPGVVFGVSQQSAQPGQTATARVTISGFSQVTSAQFTLAWDPAVLRYVGVGDYGLRGLAAGSFGTPLTGSGKLTFAWYDPGGVGVTLADGTVLFTASFEVIGQAGSFSALALAGSPTVQQVSVNFALAAFGAQDGSVAVIGPGVQVNNPVYANGVFRLSVPTEKGRSYVLEFTHSLTPANWTALPAVAGDGTVIVLTDSAATNSHRFYRVRVE